MYIFMCLVIGKTTPKLSFPLDWPSRKKMAPVVSCTLVVTVLLCSSHVPRCCDACKGNPINRMPG